MLSIRWRRGFTLIELLVVIAIIAILIALLLPAVQAARESARRTQCKDHLHNYGVALHSYHETNNTFPIGGTMSWSAGVVNWDDAAGNVGWQVRILPQMENGPIFNALNLAAARPWDNSVGGQPARRRQVPYATCPSDYSAEPWGDNEWARASYSGSIGANRATSEGGDCQPWLAFADPNTEDHANHESRSRVSGMFSRWACPVRFGDVKDGLSNTIQVGEILADCHDHGGGWWYFNAMGNAHATTTVPLNDMTTCEKPIGKISDPNCSFKTLGWGAKQNWNYSWGFRSAHTGGAHFLFGDGTAKFVSETIDHQTYVNLGGRSDGKVAAQP